ncbi:hypothetical protein D3C84_1227710 [compost metagenome]
MSVVLGGWSFPRNIGNDVAAIKPYLQKANMILPIDAVLTCMGLYIGLQLVLMAYYWITRAINLIRGAG